MQLRTASSILLLLLSLSCQQDKTDESTSTPEFAEAEIATPAKTAKDSSVAKTPVGTPKLPNVTCDSLGIPSYDLWIKDLTEMRCVSCHNENFAWNGVVLTNYTAFANIKDKAKYRIQNNSLTKPLDPIEQGIFLAWFENKLPRTEADCTGPTKP